MTDTGFDGSGVNYDPYDFEIDTDPYPAFRRLRDEAPLYHNDTYGFYALSRYGDVKDAFVDWHGYRSGKGMVLELIKSGAPVPNGFIVSEDPPAHDLHRGLLARVFTPRRIAEIEPKVRAFCAATLDPLVDKGRFDFVADFGCQIPMRTIGMMLGIPESDQGAGGSGRGVQAVPDVGRGLRQRRAVAHLHGPRIRETPRYSGRRAVRWFVRCGRVMRHRAGGVVEC